MALTRAAAPETKARAQRRARGRAPVSARRSRSRPAGRALVARKNSMSSTRPRHGPCSPESARTLKAPRGS